MLSKSYILLILFFGPNALNLFTWKKCTTTVTKTWRKASSRL